MFIWKLGTIVLKINNNLNVKNRMEGVRADMDSANNSRKKRIEKIFNIVCWTTVVLGIIIGYFVGRHFLDTDFNEEEIANIKEKICFVWENGMQIECDKFALKEQTGNINLYNLTTKPLSSPENSEVEFYFEMNGFRIAREGNYFYARNPAYTKGIHFAFEDNYVTASEHVYYVSVIMLHMIICFFAVVFLFSIEGLLLAVSIWIEKIKRRNKN